MRCYVRLMRSEDITQVTEIDHEAFPTMWPPPNYRSELNNRLAHYIVALDEEKRVEEPDIEAAPEKRRFWLASWVRRLFNHDRLLGSEPTSSAREYIAGFAGFWIMADEAHITNIAVRKIHYRMGIGELLLIALIDLATKLNARIITLEVRASNIAAQSLYSKYGFTQVGLRRGYYTDDGEDGILMSTEDITSASFQAHLQQLRQSHSRRWGITSYEIVRNYQARPGRQ